MHSNMYCIGGRPWCRLSSWFTRKSILMSIYVVLVIVLTASTFHPNTISWVICRGFPIQFTIESFLYFQPDILLGKLNVTFVTVLIQVVLHFKHSNYPSDRFRFEHLLLHLDPRQKVPRKHPCWFPWQVAGLWYGWPSGTNWRTCLLHQSSIEPLWYSEGSHSCHYLHCLRADLLRFLLKNLDRCFWIQLTGRR